MSFPSGLTLNTDKTIPAKTRAQSLIDGDSAAPHLKLVYLFCFDLFHCLEMLTRMKLPYVLMQ